MKVYWNTTKRMSGKIYPGQGKMFGVEHKNGFLMLVDVGKCKGYKKGDTVLPKGRFFDVIQGLETKDGKTIYSIHAEGVLAHERRGR